MGIPHSVSDPQKRPTKVTLFFTIEEIKALNARFRQLVPPDHVVFEENFIAYCLWSTLFKTVQTAKIFFRAFDAQRRGYFDFEDFCMTTGSLTRGNSVQLAEILLRMISESKPMSAIEAQVEVQKEEATYSSFPSSSMSAPRASSPYRQTPNDKFVKYQDVVECIGALDTTFVCLKCDGGVSAQSVAARLPFDEFGHLSFEDLTKKVGEKTI